MVELRRLAKEDRPRLRQFWRERWGDEFVVAHGTTYYPDALDGFVALDGGEWVGRITYTFLNGDCEVVSIDSTREGQGIGSKLIEAVVAEARERNCRRVFLITTNDNLNALRFYQKRGFELVRVDRGAVHASRKMKSAIPWKGMYEIPLRDELELEMPLKG